MSTPRHVLTFRHAADSLVELVAVYRLVRDACTASGLPDLGDVGEFTLECEFTGPRALEPQVAEALLKQLRDLELFARIEVDRA